MKNRRLLICMAGGIIAGILCSAWGIIYGLLIELFATKVFKAGLENQAG